MTPERWQRVNTVFRRARERDPSDRPALLDEACGGDTALRREVESLLAVYDEPDDLLEEPLLAPEAGEALWAAAAAGGEIGPDAPPATPTVVSEPAAGARAGAGALVGETLDGKYRIDALLGRGGMGEVYRATHLQLERQVAVKLVRADLVDSSAALERFVREARMVARLRHPNIVTVYDYGVAEGAGAYLVMELLEGRTLRAALRERKRFDARGALDLIAQVCDAIAAAHRTGVVHRDLKPDNILLERGAHGPAVKVLDFGLAKLAEEVGPRRAAITNMGTVLGTPTYMAPEQCRGQEADARTDVYALGCILYEMLTGRPPFTAPTVTALLYKHVHEPPRRPGELVEGLDPALEAAILGALAKAPERRPATADDFARALGARGAAVGHDTPGPAGLTTDPGAPSTGAFEGVRTGAGAAPTNLRHAVTRFVGREREIAEVREWLDRTRLVTLVGPGGIGKTRLAVEAATLLLGEYRDGVWLVELAGLANEALVDQTVASALGVREQGERPVAESLAEWLETRQLLLVLDNCEHLVAACARLAEGLLGAAPGLRVLATSREALGVPGEAAWPVPALAVPAGADGALECEATALFADRASLARPGFEPGASAALVADLCRRLEGIPLAIELAAARVKALSVEQILERLDDRFRLLVGGSRTAPGRHQTLRAALDWSYDLLDVAERALLGRLSVFAGGWELETAEEVCAGAPFEASDVLDLLTHLVDKSLVAVEERAGRQRYRLLETVREYARERLDASGGRDDAARRHAEYFVTLAEASRSEMFGARAGEWAARLEAEHDNVRAALAWSHEHDAEQCLRLALGVHQFRLLHGYVAETRRWLESALALGDATPAHLRARALEGAGAAARIQGDPDAARRFLERGVSVARQTGSLRQLATLTCDLGAIAILEGDPAAARAHLEESLGFARETGYDVLVAVSLNSLGEVSRIERDWAAARRCLEEAAALCRKEGVEQTLSIVLCNLGAVLLEGADLDAARACYDEALATAHALGSKEFISLAVDGLGAVAAGRGEPERAARLAGAAEALLDETGAKLEPLDRDFRDRYRAAARERLGEARFEALLAEGRSMSLETSMRVAVDG
jgi:non-specific serine/threonine protein kinase